MLYKYAWTPVIKGTHSLITYLTFLRVLTHLSLGVPSAGNPFWVQTDMLEITDYMVSWRLRLTHLICSLQEHI